jgi:hypothetical protein
VISHDDMLGIIATEAAESIYMKTDTLKTAATNLYLAGRWDCQSITPEQSAKLWEALRDALRLPHGTATSAGVAAENGQPTADLRAELQTVRTQYEAWQVHTKTLVEGEKELRAEVERLREWYQAYAEGEGCEFKPSEWKALRDKALEQLATEREKNEALEKALRAYEKHT